MGTRNSDSFNFSRNGFDFDPRYSHGYNQGADLIQNQGFDPRQSQGFNYVRNSQTPEEQMGMSQNPVNYRKSQAFDSPGKALLERNKSVLSKSIKFSNFFNDRIGLKIFSILFRRRIIPL